MKNRITRWRYIVDWKLQGSLILHGITYGGLVLLAVSVGIFSPLLWDLGVVNMDGGYEEQAIVMLYLHERFWLLAMMCLVLVVLGAVRFSHRVAGPMVRFKRNLKLLSEGKFPPPLRTRRADFLKEEVGCLNKAVVGVGERIDAIRRAQVDLRRKLTDCAASIHEPSADFEAVIGACDELERTVRMFHHVEEPLTLEPEVEPVAKPELVGSAGGV
ncbi:MAG: hypothetical protein ACI89X_002603 [Planctomycetota bacterium]|jgi:hypothetical protein